VEPGAQIDVDELTRSLDAVGAEASAAVAAAETVSALDEVRNRYLAKKGPLQQVLKRMGQLAAEDRPVVGAKANLIRDAIADEIERRRRALAKTERAARLEAEAIDITLPGAERAEGSLHPVTQVINEAVRIFTAMGFSVATGPDVEDDWHNFEALNILPDHPARDMHDTLYLSDSKLLLRTHTSPVQIRVMQSQPPPVAIICPGKVYRHDELDQSHSPMFHQIEGLLVDTDISFAHLKGVLEEFIHAFFGPDVPVRFRPSYFPFTEPSAEVDMMLKARRRVGDKVVEVEEWSEILGCGMVHPKVLEAVHYDPEKVSGFAFGMGADRLARIKYGVGDIRLFFENDVRFLSQF
jgi:phenylalanyl-tRNA synthetase alpha chain